jgi:hypothetical protein
MDYTKYETWILLLFVFFFGVLIARYVFSIDKMLKNQDRTLRLLNRIAEKIGVDKSSIEEAED